MPRFDSFRAVPTRFQEWIWGAILVGLASACGARAQAEATPTDVGTAAVTLIGWTNLTAWSTNPATGTLPGHWVSPLTAAVVPWSEMIVSWNLQPAEGSGLTLEAQAVLASGEATKFYSLGQWSLDGREPVARTSPGRQRDEHGQVKTDTLVLRHPATAFRLRISLLGEAVNHPEWLRFLGVSLCQPGIARFGREPERRAWGHSLDVPQRSQVAYAGGKAWCSPTTVSMLLGWWAQRLQRPELDRDVPIVAQAVDDPGWPGTGNWPFNTAYPGSFPGMLGCAARLRDLRDLEDLTLAGIPVAISVSAPVLHGKSPSPESGHLIICAGFTAEGDVVANDPWARLETGQTVRRTYARADVAKAWASSERLAYLILPWTLAPHLPAQWR